MKADIGDSDDYHEEYDKEAMTSAAEMIKIGSIQIR
jgi:hypothetical protein